MLNVLELKRVTSLKDRDRVRLARLTANIKKSRFPLCAQKLSIIHESYQKYKSLPEIIKQAKAFESVLLNIPIWIDEYEQIVGHGAAKPWGVELDPFYGFPAETEIKNAVSEGVFSLEEEEWRKIKEIADSGEWDKYALTTRGFAPLDHRLGDFLEVGIWLPPQPRSVHAMGHYGSGLNLISSIHVSVPHFKKVLQYGLWYFINKAREELLHLRCFSVNDIEKKLFLEAVIIILQSVIKYAARYAKLAREMALRESDQSRKEELYRIAEICDWVPGNPPRNFREAIQAYWFWYLMHNPSNVMGMGRFDQLLYPYYKQDKERGEISDEEVLALLCELRIKDMELFASFITREKRKQFSGFAKWHNMVIGGLTPDGKDATNELTFLVLEAIKLTQTPHHTVTLRVHKESPEELITYALETVRLGIGMPAFVGDESYIQTLRLNGVPQELANDYCLGGCLDVAIPGLVHRVSATFFSSIKVLELFLNNGVDPRTGIKLSPFEFNVEDLMDFEHFFRMFKLYYDYCMAMWVECINITCWAWAELWHHLLEASMLEGNLNLGRTFYKFPLPYGMAAVVYPVGLINVANSLAAIKKIVFEDKKVTLKELKEALKKNWEGYEDIRTLFLRAPKYGNDDDYVDSIASELYKMHGELAQKYDFIFGGKVLPAGISITSMWAAGSITGATPDGRFAGEVTADGTHSAQQGTDLNGPTALIKSAIKIDQTPYLCTLLNMKFHPNALKTEQDLKKLAVLIRTYFEFGGKHVQFNVIDSETLREAQRYPEKHANLIVRVAGYSAYFTQLSKAVQDEIIRRTEFGSL